MRYVIKHSFLTIPVWHFWCWRHSCHPRHSRPTLLPLGILTVLIVPVQHYCRSGFFWYWWPLHRQSYRSYLGLYKLFWYSVSPFPSEDRIRLLSSPNLDTCFMSLLDRWVVYYNRAVVYLHYVVYIHYQSPDDRMATKWIHQYWEMTVLWSSITSPTVKWLNPNCKMTTLWLSLTFPTTLNTTVTSVHYYPNVQFYYW